MVLLSVTCLSIGCFSVMYMFIGCFSVTYLYISQLGCIRSVVDLGKHCVLDVVPSAVDKLNYAQYYPIVIHLKSDNYKTIKGTANLLSTNLLSPNLLSTNLLSTNLLSTNLLSTN